MLFFKANAAQATVVKNVLNTYAEATGQLMNPGSVPFSLQNRVLLT
jgi:hypothetical protein